MQGRVKRFWGQGYRVNNHRPVFWHVVGGEHGRVRRVSPPFSTKGEKRRTLLGASYRPPAAARHMHHMVGPPLGM